jgi:hypothetical protein
MPSSASTSDARARASVACGVAPRTVRLGRCRFDFEKPSTADRRVTRARPLTAPPRSTGRPPQAVKGLGTRSAGVRGATHVLTRGTGLSVLLRVAVHRADSPRPATTPWGAGVLADHEPMARWLAN